MDEDASSGYDEDLDLPEPPSPPSDYIQLAFLNTDWSSEISLYTNDIREHRDLYGPDVEIWEMQVSTDSDETSAILSFDSSDPAEITCTLRYDYAILKF